MNQNDRRNAWDFPLVLPKDPVRRFAKVALGRTLVAMVPGLERRILSTGANGTRFDNIAVAGLVAKHTAAGTLEKLAPLHASFWAGNDAVDFHAKHEQRFHESFLGPHYVLAEALANEVAKGGFDTLIEIGCGSGQVINYLAGRLPLTRFIGNDLSSGQIEKNRARYRNPKLSFVAGDGAELVRNHARPGLIVFAYGGVFEYFTEQALRDMFSNLRKHSPICVALGEPVDKSYDFTTETASRAAGSELSFTHNYQRILRDCGFEIRWAHETDTGFRWLMLIATVGP